MQHNKIVLVGYMGSGKTTIGKKLSKIISYEFIDLDAFIEEKENLTINEIFKTKGEIYFRKIEHLYFIDIINQSSNFILSLGGGTPCYANNHLELKRSDITSIYLKSSIQTIINRVKNNNKRPLLNNINDLESFIGQHLFERSYFYNFSKFKVDNNENDLNKTVNRIINILNN